MGMLTLVGSPAEARRAWSRFSDPVPLHSIFAPERTAPIFALSSDSRCTLFSKSETECRFACVSWTGRRRVPARSSTSVSRRSEEHTSELQSLMRISYAVFCLKKKKKAKQNHRHILSTHRQPD